MSFPITRSRASRWHCALVSTLLFALGAAACGGSTADGAGPEPGPPLNPPRPGGDTNAPAPPAPPAKPVVPPQPVGPYSGVVGTTDVSILYPMPLAGASKDFVRPTEIGNHGALLPASVIDFGAAALERTSPEPPSGYAQLAVVSVRLDPCSARRGAGTCTSEVRLVFQALYDKDAGVADDPVAGSAATDGALHVTYDVPQEELVVMMKELLTLKQANGGLALHQLAPHPILATQGLGGAFAQGLRNVILFHLGEARIARITSFDHNMDLDGDGWRFAMFDRNGATFTARTIPGLAEHQQLVGGSSTSVALADASVFVLTQPAGALESVIPLVAESRPAVGSAQVAALQPAFEAALRVQNPALHSAETTDCANCHLAEGARRVGESVYSLVSASAFTHARSLAYESQQPTVTNLHAFGYLHRKVSIMQRTANESVLVADWMESRVGVPK